MTPIHAFSIGSRIQIGDAYWRVVKYHKIGRGWEIIFRSEATGVHKSISLAMLDRFAVPTASLKG